MSTALDYAASRAERQWSWSHSRGLFAWLLRQLGTIRPVSAVWICQYKTGNWHKARCYGEPVQVWRYDDKGLAQAGHAPELDQSSATASATPVIGFCLDDTGERMIYQEWNGLRAGSGAILVLKKDSGKWVAQGRSWVS